MTEELTKLSDEFGTPDDIFTDLRRIFNFTIDAAASSTNAKLNRYWTKQDNALLQSWACERVFCNPPYSRGNVEAFAMKALKETEKNCPLAVLLIPTRTEQYWFHTCVNSGRVLVKFFKHRIQFIGGKSSARDSHMLMIFLGASEHF